MKKYKSLRAYVRCFISESIYSGELKPGDRINEQNLASRLSVSRTPAREALMQLESEGLLTYTPRRGFTIKNITPQEMRDNYAVMAIMDAQAARLALPFLDETDLVALNECVEKIDVAIKYKNRDDYRLLQHQFHDRYRQKCDNMVILRILESLESGLTPEVFVSDDTERLFELYKIINNEHRAIIRLIQAGDVEELFSYLHDRHWALDREEVNSGFLAPAASPLAK